MKWFRRNNRRIMAVAVVGLMFVFIGGSALRMTCRYAGPRSGAAIALFGEKKKITRADTDRANRQLEVLGQLGAEFLLRSRDVHGLLLSELLFSEKKISPAFVSTLRQEIRANQLRISDEQILDMTRKTEPPEVYWHLLKEEAKSAGAAISKSTAENVLRQVIPNMYRGESYSVVINRFIDRGFSENEILSAFADLFTILEYASVTCSNENLTRVQLSRLVKDSLETLEAEFVRIPAELFTDAQDEPDESSIRQQFQQYKSFYPGQVTQDNPYGFGYKLDERVQLDYIVIKLDDVEKIIEKPTEEELQNYYLLHKSEFVEQVPIDPNDPNSFTMEQTVSFGRVRKVISNQLIAERIAQKAEEILSRAENLTVEKYGDKDVSELTAEQIKNLAVDFGSVAEKLQDEYPVKVYSGRTGLLRFIDFQQDENLSGFFLRPTGPGRMPQPLSRLAFSVGRPESPEPALTDIPAPKIYETIGPVFDPMTQLAALIRVVDVKDAVVPAGFGFTFSVAKVNLEQPDAGADEQVYSTRQKVVEDLNIIAAMQSAKEKADEFLTLAQEEGWDKAVDEFNRQYPPDGPDEPNNFGSTSWTDLKQPSPDIDAAIVARNRGTVGGHLAIGAHNRDKMILDTLFSIVPFQQSTPPQLPVTVEVIPDHSYYCVKSLSINRVDRDEYDRTKTLVAYQHDRLEGLSLSIVHFNPENILERMNFRLITKPKQPAEPNEPEAENQKTPGES